VKRILRSLGFALAAALTVSACAPNSQNTAASLAEEQRASQQLVQKLDQKGSLIKDKGLNGYMRGIVDRVAKQRPPGSVPLRTYIVKDADVNAFTTGGGYLFFNAGMLAAMENEAQLASVTAHEIAHIDRGHIQAGKATRQGVQVGAALAGIGGALLGVPGQVTDLAVGLGANLAVNSFTRSQETDADTTGFGYMSRAGYNGLEGAKSFDVLRNLYGDAKGPQAAFFSSHPASSDRKANLTRLAQQSGATKGRVGNKTHDKAVRKLRRDILKFYESQGRTKEAALIRRNLRN
jgi:predicted Zn-dependent protease